MKKKNTEKNRQTYMQNRLRMRRVTTKSGKRQLIDNYAETVKSQSQDECL